MNGNGLKQLIIQKGFRMDYLAKEIGINAATLRLIASGHRKTSRPVIKLLAQLLDVTEDELEAFGILQSEAG